VEEQDVRGYCVLLILFLVGCDNTSKEGMDKMQNGLTIIDVNLGGAVADLISSSPLKFSTDCLAVVGMCWYEIRRGGKDQPLMNISVSWPEGTSLIKNAVGLNVLSDETQTKNVENFRVTLRGLPDNSPHAENKELVYELISELKASGWKRYYYPSTPRLSGTELIKSGLTGSAFGNTSLSNPLFDADYEMSLTEWLGTDGFYGWYMYSGDYISHVTAWRSSSLTDPALTGTYLINVKFMSLDNFWRKEFAEAVRPQWKELFPAHLQQLRNKRLISEARAKAAGISIDEDYLPPHMERVN
jgi:hypothetical protein